MTTMNIQQIRDELCHFIRYSDVLTTAIRGVTIASQTFTATAGQTQFQITNYPVRDIRSLTVQSVAKYYLRDYTVNFNTGLVTLNTGATLNDAVVFSYDYGSGDKIYPDFPRDDLTLVSFPRIGIELTSIATKPLGLGGTTHISDLLMTFILAVPANRDSSVNSGFGGLTDLESTWNLIRSAIRTNAKLFYTFTWISPIGTGPIFKGQYNKIMQQTADYQIRFKVE